MTHIKLLETICKYKQVINSAYIEGEITSIPSELIQCGVFRKIGREYKLADTYIQFANTMLKKVDIDVTFGNYIEEQKKLINLKSEYLKTDDFFYISRIKSLAGKLYERLADRDIGINAKVNDIISDNRLSIEAVIKEAEAVDSKIAELIGENINIRVLFNEELMSIDNQELKELLVDIGIDMEILNNNIHAYIQRLSDFILRTKKRKEQNNKLSSISNKIMREQDQDLASLLLSNAQSFYHTIRDNKRNIKFFPKESHIEKRPFIDALNSIIEISKTERKAPAKNDYALEEPIEYKGINIEGLLRDIQKEKPGDIYKFIKKHQELKQFTGHKESQMYAFQVYLTIVLESEKNIDLTNDFNENNVRIAKWI